MDKEMEQHFGMMTAELVDQVSRNGGRVLEYFHRLPGIDVKIIVSPRDDRIWVSGINDAEKLPDTDMLKKTK